MDKHKSLSGQSVENLENAKRKMEVLIEKLSEIVQKVHLKEEKLRTVAEMHAARNDNDLVAKNTLDEEFQAHGAFQNCKHNIELSRCDNLECNPICQLVMCYPDGGVYPVIRSLVWDYPSNSPFNRYIIPPGQQRDERAMREAVVGMFHSFVGDLSGSYEVFCKRKLDSYWKILLRYNADDEIITLPTDAENIYQCDCNDFYSQFDLVPNEKSGIRVEVNNIYVVALRRTTPSITHSSITAAIGPVVKSIPSELYLRNVRTEDLSPSDSVYRALMFGLIENIFNHITDVNVDDREQAVAPLTFFIDLLDSHRSNQSKFYNKTFTDKRLRGTSKVSNLNDDVDWLIKKLSATESKYLYLPLLNFLTTFFKLFFPDSNYYFILFFKSVLS
jgi:hypothetical protein